MTHVNFFNRPADKALNNFMDDFFKVMPAATETKYSVPVNIFESNDAYRIDVITPGFDKNDFKVNIEKNILTISLEKDAVKKEENVKQLRNEYTFRPFKRSFTLDAKFDTEKIEASYNNGVLSLNLPLKVEVKTPVKQIAIQ